MTPYPVLASLPFVHFWEVCFPSIKKLGEVTMKGLEVFFFCQTHKKEEPSKVHLEFPKAGITANATTKLPHNSRN